MSVNSSVVTEAITVRLASLCRTDAVIGLALFALVIGIWIPRFSGPIDLRWDGSVYYILGTSLAEGKGYRLLNEPGEIEAVQYPPLLPLIVAVHQWVLGTNDPLIVGHSLRLSFFLIFTAYILAIYLMLRNSLPLNYAFVGTMMCLFSLQTYFMSDLLFPEIPFALATVLFFLCNQNKSRRIYPILAALFAMAAYALRTIGIALLAAWVAESLFRREFKNAAVRLTVSIIPILCWQVYISSVESGREYRSPVYEYQRADYSFYNVSYGKNIFYLKASFSPEMGDASFGDISWRFMRNLAELQTSLGGAVSIKNVRQAQWEQFSQQFPFVPVDPWPVYIPLMILSYLIVGGIGLQLANREWFIPLYILISLAAMCLTPWPGQFHRYLVPLAPFLSLSLFKMLLAVKNWSYRVLPAKWNGVGLAFVCLIVSFIFVQQSFTSFLVYTRWHQKVTYTNLNGSKDVYRLFFYHDSYRTLDGALDWLKERAKPDDVVAVSMPHWVHLRTGLKAVMPPFESDPVKAQQLLDSVPVSYLVLDEELAVDTRKYTSPVVQNFSNRWKRIYSASVISELGVELKDRFQIYERVEPLASSAPAFESLS
jgi:4-amino-4-deoxy-L-arabinose transferase-like glycosyltransferase